MTFVRRSIEIDITGKASVQLVDHRVTVRAVKNGGVGMGQAQVSIYGMRLDLMNQLATFGTVVHPQYDIQCTIKAGDEINGMGVIFQGNITQAWADFQSAPDVPFHLIVAAGAVQAVQPGVVSSYSGPTDVGTVMQQLAKQMNLQFENNGVNVKIDSPYLWGSPRNQALALVKAAGIEWIIDDGKLAIWPVNGSRKSAGGGGLVLSKDNQMVSYPTFTEYGVLVKCEYSRPIVYGSTFTIKSDITPANREWTVRMIDYDLQSLTPRGHWFVSLSGMADPSAAFLLGP